MDRVAVIGAGNSGLATAAHLSLQGHPVNLWNRSPERVSDLLSSHTIDCSGVITGAARLQLVTSDMAEAIDGVRMILVTTPADAHSAVAAAMAPYVSADAFVVLNPGRTLGSLEFRNFLLANGCTRVPAVAEAQTIVYTCRSTGPSSVAILAMKSNVLISCLKDERPIEVDEVLPDCLRPHFVPARSTVETSFGNVGMILHCAPVLLNTGWIENTTTRFKYYYDGITPSIARFLERLDRERLSVMAGLGIEGETIVEWFERTYGVVGDCLHSCLQLNEAYRTIEAPTSLNHRYILEDVPCGLVPLEAVGKRLGLPMILTTLVVDLASELMGVELRKTGRSLDRLGLDAMTSAELAKTLRSL